MAGIPCIALAARCQAGATYRVSIFSTVGGDAIGGEAEKTFVF